MSQVQTLTSFLTGLALDSVRGNEFRTKTSDAQQIQNYVNGLPLSDTNKHAILQAASLGDPILIDEAIQNEWRNQQVASGQHKSPIRVAFTGAMETYYA
jgi:hypothetical protein